MPATTATERRIASDRPEATRALAARLARVARRGDLVCLRGELGAGKTEFAKGFGAGLGIADTINSPSFVLMAEYAGRLPLFHIDLYRLADAADAVQGGLIDERQADGVTLVEWPERITAILPAARLDVTIGVSDDGRRTIALHALDPRYARYLEAAA
jgi:tRNA threonylcarbamoyladenosine biosynthesis protein TsaE